MRENLFVHCGMHKAGSSAIQDTLAVAPLGAPFQYIAPGMPNGSLAVSQAFSANFKGRMERRGRTVTAEDLQRVRRRGRQTMAVALGGWTSRKGIISAEDISGFSDGELENLREMFERYCSSVSAIIYVRAPKSYVESSFQQILKTHMPRFSEKPLKLHFRKKFAPFDRVFGLENVEIRWYSRPFLHNGCVVQDFGKTIGLHVDPAWVISSNRSLSLEAVKLLYIYRNSFKIPDDQDKPVLSFLQQVRSARFSFHPELAAKLCDVDPAQQRWLAKRVGSDWPEDDGAVDDTGVRSLGELMEPAAGTLEMLAAASDSPISLLKSPQKIAETLRMLSFETTS